jgi:quercetin dioxygenase-like cupin family protein
MISYDDTPCFGENRHTIKNGGGFVMDFAPSVYICLEGKAVITGENYKKEIKKGDYFYLPFVAENKFAVSSETSATIIECLPSKQ